jgi:hypothetical protein
MMFVGYAIMSTSDEVESSAPYRAHVLGFHKAFPGSDDSAVAEGGGYRLLQTSDF